MTTDIELKTLRKKFYLACRDTLPTGQQYDGAIRDVRDHVAHDLFGKQENELTVKELRTAISNLKGGVGSGHANAKYATMNQINTIRFYGLTCAIEYANLNGMAYRTVDGTELTGEALRAWAKSQYTNKKALPENFVRHLFDAWVNPECHRFLREYPSLPHEPRSNVLSYTDNNMYLERLFVKEASYLIKRFGNVYNNISNKKQMVINPELN